MVMIIYLILMFLCAFRIALKREDAVSKEMMKKLADDKRMTKKEKDERWVYIIIIILISYFQPSKNVYIYMNTYTCR